MSRRVRGRTVRIIGGNWRGRKVSFADHALIRPTPDRIRETLFNWLQYDIHGSRCLELYAGSGILSIEALSRGAAHVTLVEKSPDIMTHVQRTLKSLGADEARYNCHNAAARDWLTHPGEGGFNIVFLDPPFGSEELGTAMALLATSPILADDARIYVESDFAIDDDALPAGWRIHRQKRAGQVHYCLLSTTAGVST